MSANVSPQCEHVPKVVVLVVFTLVAALILVVVAGAIFISNLPSMLLCGPTSLHGEACYATVIVVSITLGAVISQLAAIMLFRNWIRRRRLLPLALAVVVAVSLSFSFCNFLAHANWGI